MIKPGEGSTFADVLAAKQSEFTADEARRDAGELAEVARHAAAEQNEHPALPDPEGWTS